jgi:hypothetical protein
MSQEKEEIEEQEELQKAPNDDDTPAHATQEERERLKDFNKDGIPPGAW